MIQFVLMAVAAKRFGSAQLRGCVRATGYTAAVVVALGAFGMHKARASVGEQGMRLGEDLASLSALLGDARTFEVNGQKIHVATATTLDGVTAVLDKFESSCELAAGGDAPIWNSIPGDQEIVAAANRKPLTKMPIFRNQQGHKGVLICVVPPDSAPSVQASVDAFVKTGELLNAGKLRYAYVTEGATGSSVFTAWTDDKFNVQALVPQAGQDTPGSDPPTMARPANARRMLTGAVEGLPYKIFAYRTQGAPKEAIDSYDAQMHAAGWVSVRNPSLEGAPHDGFEAHAYWRDGAIGYATASQGAAGSTYVGVAETGSPPVLHVTSPLKDADGF